MLRANPWEGSGCSRSEAAAPVPDLAIAEARRRLSTHLEKVRDSRLGVAEILLAAPDILGCSMSAR